MGLLGLIKYHYANRTYDSKRLYLINKGAKIGLKTRLNCTTDAFGSEPYLITIGDDCLFATDIKFITHDGGIKVLNSLQKYYDGKMDKIERIVVGNNVYIGTGAYIMPGVNIGDNVIIGAKALVTHDIPSNSVAVGIPAKVISDLDSYYKKCIIKNNLYRIANLSKEEKRKFFEEILKL